MGTVTTGLVFEVGGTAPAGQGTGPITLLFEPNALMSSPAWPNANNGTGAITVPNRQGVGLGYVVIDGGENGIIQNTANGTGLAYQLDSVGVALMETHDSVVRNLTVQNLYVRHGPNGDANAFGTGVKIFGYGGTQPATNDLVTKCVFHDEFHGVYISYGKNWKNLEYSFSTVYNCSMGGNAGDGNALGSLDGLKVHDNNFSNFTNWDDNSGSNRNHHNGFYGWAVSGGTLRNVSYYNNLIGPNFGAHATSGLYVSGDIGGVLIYNNIFTAAGATDYPGDGYIYVLPNLGFTGTGFRLYNNTFTGKGAGIAINLTYGYGPLLTVYDVKNNVASGVGTFLAVFDNLSSTLVSDHNLLSNMSSTMSVSTSPTLTGHFYTLPAWQALGYDIHTTTLSANLSTSFSPVAPSGAIGTGLNLLSYFTTDMDGTSRPASGAWDVGALQPESGAPVITSSSSASGNQGSNFTYDITASGSPTRFAATGLPAGLSVNSTTGVISGAASVLGTYPVTITATNGAGSGSEVLSLVINIHVPVIVAVPPTITAPQGIAYSYSLSATNSPTGFSATGLPPGLTMNPTTGHISGTATTIGNYGVTISARNAGGTGTFFVVIDVIAAINGK